MQPSTIGCLSCDAGRSLTFVSWLGSEPQRHSHSLTDGWVLDREIARLLTAAGAPQPPLDGRMLSRDRKPLALGEFLWSHCAAGVSALPARRCEAKAVGRVIGQRRVAIVHLASQRLDRFTFGKAWRRYLAALSDRVNYRARCRVSQRGVPCGTRSCGRYAHQCPLAGSRRNRSNCAGRWRHNLLART